MEGPFPAAVTAGAGDDTKAMTPLPQAMLPSPAMNQEDRMQAELQNPSMVSAAPDPKSSSSITSSQTEGTGETGCGIQSQKTSPPSSSPMLAESTTQRPNLLPELRTSFLPHSAPTDQGPYNQSSQASQPAYQSVKSVHGQYSHVQGKICQTCGFSPENVPCQICGESNHKALDCFHRMDFSYQGRQPPSKLAAMANQSPLPKRDHLNLPSSYPYGDPVPSESLHGGGYRGDKREFLPRQPHRGRYRRGYNHYDNNFDDQPHLHKDLDQGQDQLPSRKELNEMTQRYRRWNQEREDCGNNYELDGMPPRVRGQYQGQEYDPDDMPLLYRDRHHRKEYYSTDYKANDMRPSYRGRYSVQRTYPEDKMETPLVADDSPATPLPPAETCYLQREEVLRTAIVAKDQRELPNPPISSATPARETSSPAALLPRPHPVHATSSQTEGIEQTRHEIENQMNPSSGAHVLAEPTKQPPFLSPELQASHLPLSAPPEQGPYVGGESQSSLPKGDNPNLQSSYPNDDLVPPEHLHVGGYRGHDFDSRESLTHWPQGDRYNRTGYDLYDNEFKDRPHSYKVRYQGQEHLPTRKEFDDMPQRSRHWNQNQGYCAYNHELDEMPIRARGRYQEPEYYPTSCNVGNMSESYRGRLQKQEYYSTDGEANDMNQSSRGRYQVQAYHTKCKVETPVAGALEAFNDATSVSLPPLKPPYFHLEEAPPCPSSAAIAAKDMVKPSINQLQHLGVPYPRKQPQLDEDGLYGDDVLAATLGACASSDPSIFPPSTQDALHATLKETDYQDGCMQLEWPNQSFSSPAPATTSSSPPTLHAQPIPVHVTNCQTEGTEQTQLGIQNQMNPPSSSPMLAESTTQPPFHPPELLASLSPHSALPEKCPSVLGESQSFLTKNGDSNLQSSDPYGNRVPPELWHSDGFKGHDLHSRQFLHSHSGRGMSFLRAQDGEGMAADEGESGTLVYDNIVIGDSSNVVIGQGNRAGRRVGGRVSGNHIMR